MGVFAFTCFCKWPKFSQSVDSDRGEIGRLPFGATSARLALLATTRHENGKLCSFIKVPIVKYHPIAVVRVTNVVTVLMLKKLFAETRESAPRQSP